MESKNKYHIALQNNNGRLNEIELGEKIGLDEEATNRVITQLLAEHKIEFIAERNCSYRPKKKERKTKRYD
ncbi:MAG: hypothetical protein AAFQ94_13910 [Bacteroidota bacterium]